jgi:HTH-type transcriptional regulator/antitoxin HigA
MEPKVIKNEQSYHSILQEAERLVSLDPDAGSKDAERLELFTVLVEDYERRKFSFETPDPIDAIEFRMYEQGLRQKDIVPLIGSRSRVSEVLARKRPLTVPMIRALSTGLGIPLEALVMEPASNTTEDLADVTTLDWNKFPLNEMKRRGWLASLKIKANASIEEIVQAFLSQIASGAARAAMYRRNFRGEKINQKAYYSTLAWTSRVLIRAKESAVSRKVKYDPSKITPELLRDLARLSWLSEGPRLAVEFLAKYGIALIIEPRLPDTLLDGSAMATESGMPVIGLTLRYDRVDYFWFTLLHEVAHIWRHLNSKEDTFIDRIEHMDSSVLIEKEANRIARDSFIPRAMWKRSPAFLAPTKENIQQLADELHIHPAIIVGRLQYETGKFERFRDLLGQGTVRRCFPDVIFK